jgi:hypothetical protein
MPHMPELGYEVQTGRTGKYNCLSWALGVTDRWVWPKNDGDIEQFDTLLEAEGYVPIAEYPLEESDLLLTEGLEKVVLFGKIPSWIETPDQLDVLRALHAMKQEDDGSWTSKMGALERVRLSDPDAQAGDSVLSYGMPLRVYARPRANKS